MRYPIVAPAAVLIGSLLLVSACAHPLHGTSRMEVLGMPESHAPSRGGSGQVQAGTEEVDYIPAQPLKPLEKPGYPEGILAEGPRVFTMTVVITVSPDGAVSEVARSWKDGVAASSPFADDFLAAIRSAASRWSVQGARQVYYRRTESGEREYQRTEKVSEAFEMRFTFEKSPAP